MAYQLVRDFVYDLGQTYRGEAAQTTFTFSTLKGPAGSNADTMISNLQQQCVNDGRGFSCLRTQVYVDSSSALEDDYLVTFSLYSPYLAQMDPVTIAFCITLVSLAIAFIIYMITLALREIKAIAYSPSGPALATGLKWFAIGLAVLAGGFVIKEVIAAIPKKQTVAVAKT